MKDSYTNNVGLAPAGTSGKATSRAFAAIMILLIKLLTKLGLLKKDLDYHLVRRVDRNHIGLFWVPEMVSIRGANIDSFYQQRPSYFLDVPCFRHPGGELVFGGFRMVVWRTLVLRILE